jgi:aminopeptidase N
MENTGAVIFGDYVYKTDRELLDANDQSTIAHELFHHWFGDLVTCESWANLPLNESFANYSQYLWDEHRYGIDEADFQAESETEGYFGSAENSGYFNLIRYDYADKEDMFDGHSYNKGGRILHMLRNYLGDEAFFKGLNLYLTTNKFKAAEVHNLRMAFEESVNVSLLFPLIPISKIRKNTVIQAKVTRPNAGSLFLCFSISLTPLHLFKFFHKSSLRSLNDLIY